MTKPLGPVSAEFASVDLGDKRLNARLATLTDTIAANPAASFPDQVESRADLEALYRFFSNPRVDSEDILEAHAIATRERARAESGPCLVVHDKSEFVFPGTGTREDLDEMTPNTQGFWGLLSLAITPARKPLGVVGFEPLFAKKGLKPGGRSGAAQWLQATDRTVALLEADRCIHVIDREADAYELLAHLVAGRTRFVIRGSYDREVVGEEGERRLREVLSAMPVVLQRDIDLSRRKGSRLPGPRKRHPPRSARRANLAVTARKVELPRPPRAPKELPSALTVNVVFVREVGAPPKSPAVEWVLLTTESVETETDVARVVDFYRARWTVEEYFKALKTGCAYEDRQLESKKTLLSALAIFIVVAYRLLLLRSMARESPDAPYRAVLTDAQLQLLRVRSKEKLPARMNARDCMLAIAALGGHIKNNGDPGWLVLRRGYDKLIAAELGWQARAAM